MRTWRRGLAVVHHAGHRCSRPGQVRGMGHGGDLAQGPVALPISGRTGLTVSHWHASGEWASLLPAP